MKSDPAERIELLETMLAALIDHLDAVGCYDAQGERLSDQVPVVRQARIVLGDDAWRRVIGDSRLENLQPAAVKKPS